MCKVIGYALSGNLNSSLTIEALKTAIASRHTGHGVIHRLDQGVRCVLGECVDKLKRHGFLISTACTGNPYENATMRSFSKTLKHEEVNRFQYETYQKVVTRVPRSLNDVHNHERLHSAAGYRPPDVSEEVLLGVPSLHLCRKTIVFST
jgi:putative transposase